MIIKSIHPQELKILLHRITNIDDELCRVVADDPVRPEIPLEFRISNSSEIFVLLDSEARPTAAVCAAYRESVPEDVYALFREPAVVPNVAVFYTIWSYQSGAGRDLITSACAWIKDNRKNINTYVTLSPPTEMARRFHLKNGADVFRVNSDTVNYLYP